MARNGKRVRRGPFDNSVEETPTDQENSFADRFKGNRVPRSGAYRSSSAQATGSGYGGDVELDDFIFELKQTKKKSISIKKDWLKRMSVGARPKGKMPGIQIQFSGIDATCDDRWVMIEESTFKELLDGQVKNKNEEE